MSDSSTGTRGRDRTHKMEEQEDLTLEKTIQENEWNIRYAMRTMHEAIWVKQQLIQIQQERLDRSPSYDTNVRAELRATQRMIREAEKLTSTAKDLLTVYSWHKETWQRRREDTEDAHEVIREMTRDERPIPNGVGQEEHQGRKEEKQQITPQVKEEIVEGTTALQRVQLAEDSGEQAESL